MTTTITVDDEQYERLKSLKKDRFGEGAEYVPHREMLEILMDEYSN